MASKEKRVKVVERQYQLPSIIAMFALSCAMLAVSIAPELTSLAVKSTVVIFCLCGLMLFQRLACMILAELKQGLTDNQQLLFSGIQSVENIVITCCIMVNMVQYGMNMNSRIIILAMFSTSFLVEVIDCTRCINKISAKVATNNKKLA